MLSPAVYQGVGGYSEGDDIEMRMTGIFGLFPMSTVSSQNPLLVVQHDEHDVFVDERLRIVYPRSRMVTDGLGRQVARENAVSDPEVDRWPF